MHIALVAAFPPSRLGLSEYSFNLVSALARREDVRVTVLADVNPDAESAAQYSPQISLRRIWKYNSLSTAPLLVREIRRIRPDVVWMNALLSTFGDRSLPAFTGLLLPLLLRPTGIPRWVTLHHVARYVALEDTRFAGSAPLIRAGLRVSEAILCKNASMALMLERHAAYLRQAYATKQAIKVHHGFPPVPSEVASGDSRRLLVFGKFGSYKRLDFALDVLRAVRSRHPDAEMIIAGGSHPSYPSYFETFAKEHAGEPGVIFRGYVPEEEISALFRSARMVFLPYSSSTGVSGVAHWAACYGVPIVAPQLPDFEAMCAEEGLTLVGFRPGDAADAGSSIARLLVDDTLWLSESRHNLAAARRWTFDAVVDQYINIFRHTIDAKRRHQLPVSA